MKKRLLFFTILFVTFQFSYSQTNLLSKSKRDFIFNKSINNFEPISEVVEVFNMFEFKKNPHILKISNVSSDPILSKEFSIISLEDDKENDLINFKLKDGNEVEYLLMLSVKKSKIIIINDLNDKKYMTDYNIVVP